MHIIPSKGSVRPARERPPALDHFLVQMRVAESRSQAHQFIRFGTVRVNGTQVRDPFFKVLPNAEVAIDSPVYVSRAGYKLQAAIDRFGVRTICRRPDEVAMDVGARMGGFTQCLLDFAGFARVHTVEMATGMIHPLVAKDSRVTVHENTDVRLLDPRNFPLEAQLIVADIAGPPILPMLRHFGRFLEPRGHLLVMVKPAYEFSGLTALDDPHPSLDALEAAVNAASCGRKEGLVFTDDGQTIREGFDRFERGAKRLGFECLGRAPSPVGLEDGRREEFFLLRPIRA